jgi:hypothetical protein
MKPLLLLALLLCGCAASSTNNGPIREAIRVCDLSGAVEAYISVGCDLVGIVPDSHYAEVIFSCPPNIKDRVTFKPDFPGSYHNQPCAYGTYEVK